MQTHQPLPQRVLIQSRMDMNRRNRQPITVKLDPSSSSWSRHYTFRNEEGEIIRLKKEALECFYDINLKQASMCLGVCLSSMKNMRVWSSQPMWPWRSVIAGFHEFTRDSITDKRNAMLSQTARDDPVLHNCLLRAQYYRNLNDSKLEFMPAQRRKRRTKRQFSRAPKRNARVEARAENQQNVISDFDWSSIDDIDFNFDDGYLSVVQPTLIVATMSGPAVTVEMQVPSDSQALNLSENVAYSEIINQIPENPVAVSDKACSNEQHENGMGSLEEIHFGSTQSLFGPI